MAGGAVRSRTVGGVSRLRGGGGAGTAAHLEALAEPCTNATPLGSVTKFECCCMHLMSGLHGTCEFDILLMTVSESQ